jgi:archaemetzincin
MEAHPVYNSGAWSVAPMAELICVVPVGDVHEEILDALWDDLRRALGVACKVAPGLPHPFHAYSSARRQYLSSYIIRELGGLDLPEASRVLGVLDLDLYAPDLNFVFGQASSVGREALIALPRLRESFYGLPDDCELFRERALKEAVHEIGHTYGLSHCPDPLCVMYFSNALADTDRKGGSLCSNCQTTLEDQASRTQNGKGLEYP